MSDDEYKAKALQGLDPTFPAIGGLLARTPVRWAPVGAAMRAQDTIPATSRRIVASWSLSGASAWAQPTGTDDPDDVTQFYPDSSWRSLGTFQAKITPGCELHAYAIASPSGLVAKDDLAGGFDGNGAWGEVRVSTRWANGASASGPHTKSAAIAGSADGPYTGEESGDPGGNWTNVKMIDIGRLRPAEYTTDPAVAAAFSEWSDVEIELEIRGGARIQQITVYEQPLSHVTEHDDSDITSVHAMPPTLAPLTPGPMTRAPDGATYEEHRHGTIRAMQVAQRQSERLGPRIMHWSCYDESDSGIWSQSEGNPVQTTSTSFVDLHDSSITTYTADTPGRIVAGAYAQLARLSAPILIGRGEIAMVPVRVRVDASRLVANGTVRVQCGQYDYVDVTVTSTRGVYEATGYIESQIVADDDSWPLAVRIRVLAGGTLNVYGVSVDFNTWA